MFLYHVRISSLLIFKGFQSLSTMAPSESITLYVGIAGCVDGCSKDSLVVNLLFTAPGKCTLESCQQLSKKLKRDSYWSEPGRWDTELHLVCLRRFRRVAGVRTPLRKIAVTRRQRRGILLSINHIEWITITQTVTPVKDAAKHLRRAVSIGI